ncbi:hypothetical protein MPTK1_5g21630 [Marchantia polymorpha subsp. ruderalis]|uniref:Uncharacterized protein n=1 Tax=Marchantia polymorpha subsp. ruderalis TaxID=1480154 RepID=A0AAF6BKU2_MARPO|nr:hypothetical protein Mp_5g21630 [Marchantia polymorpha subsp. ruderalis]
MKPSSVVKEEEEMEAEMGKAVKNILASSPCRRLDTLPVKSTVDPHCHDPANCNEGSARLPRRAAYSTGHLLETLEEVVWMVVGRQSSSAALHLPLLGPPLLLRD